MLKKPVWRCVDCGHEQPFSELYRCPRCGGQLQLCFDYEGMAAGSSWRASWGYGNTIWERFAPLLPPLDSSALVTLGEGNTPLVKAARLGRHLGLDNLYFKLEMCNPTGSFKDRQVSVALCKGIEWGYQAFGTASSGNVGVALSAYCARAGVQANVWVSRGIAPGKLSQIKVYGARLFLLPDPMETGDMANYYRVYTEMQDFCVAHRMMPMVTARPVNPLIVEGSKTVAFEIHLQLGHTPDTVIVPVGGGGLCGGTWKGFSELYDVGISATRPRILAAQHGGPNYLPLDRFDDASIDRSNLYVPLDGDWAWESVRVSGGEYLGMLQMRVPEAQALLASYEGIVAEPQGATSTAGLLEAVERGLLSRDEIVVVYITGHGLKDQASLTQAQKLSGVGEQLNVDSLASSDVYVSPPNNTTKE